MGLTRELPCVDLCFLLSCVMLCLGVFVSAQKPMDAPTCADLHLVPAVHECSDVKRLTASGGIAVSTAKDKEDELTAEDFKETAAIGGKQPAP